MSTCSVKRLWRGHWAAAALAVLAAVALVAGPAAADTYTGGTTVTSGTLDFSAADVSAAGGSPARWSLVPENAAFYSAMLRGREYFEAIVNSRAWAKIKALPIVQTGLMFYKLQTAVPGSGPNQVQTALQDPEVQKSLSLLGDLMSEEVFCYGDRNVVDFLDMAQRLTGAVKFGPAALQLSGKAQGISPEKLQATAFLSALADNVQLLQVPDAVVGFKVRDVAAVKQQLQRLEKQAAAALEGNPDLKGRLKRSEVGGISYLTLTLDGSLIPWDQVPLDDFRKIEANKGDVDKIVARLKEMTLVVAVGLRENYLLVSIGSSTDVLTRLGHGKPLAERPEMAPLRKFAGKRLISVGYVSGALSARIATNKKDIDELLKTVDSLLPLAKLPAEEREQVRKDVAALAADLKTLIPDAGAAMGLSFLTDRGLESYQYSWGPQPLLDGSRPLSLLQHVGGNPTIAAVSRGKVSVADYDLLVKWLGVGYHYFEKYAVPKMDEKEQEQFRKDMAAFLPLIGRLGRTTRDMLLPALADGQIGLVIDTKLTSKQFVQTVPATDEPLSMLEPALVFGVSDAELLRKAFVEYKAIANDMIEAARKSEDIPVPADFRLPDAKVVRNTKKGYVLYTYPPPEQWGLDGQIVPNAGLSEHVAVLSMSRAHSRRLLADTPPTVAGRPIPTDRPLAGAAAVDLAALIDAVAPWVDFCVHNSMEKPPEGEAGEDPAAAILGQVHTVLEVLKVVRTVTTQTYLEGDVTVHHAEIEIRDVSK